MRNLIAVGAVLASGVPALAQEPVLPEGFVFEAVARGLAGATDFAFVPDGRLFITEIGGTVRILDDGVLLEEPFIDLSDMVNRYGDRGLVGIAVHPLFPSLPFVYLAFAYDPPELAGRAGDAGPDGGGTRVSRLIRVTADPLTGFAAATPGSEFVLLGRNSTFAHMGDPAQRNPEVPSCGLPGAYVEDCLPADEHSHTIGRVSFGPDGMLYVASGDGADFHGPQPYHLRAQDLDSLAGKLLRINPITGGGLPDNPFWDGNPLSNRSKVLNYGLRNPFSFTFHPETGEPVIADVGWATWEEINVGVGQNFGWPCYEGGDAVSVVQPTFAAFVCAERYAELDPVVVPPVYAFDRSGTGGAVIAGGFYTGDAFPERFHGRLFVADYYQHWVRALTFDDAGNVVEVEDFATVYFPVKMAMGDDGSLYYLNIWEGTLYRIRYQGGGA